MGLPPPGVKGVTANVRSKIREERFQNPGLDVESRTAELYSKAGYTYSHVDGSIVRSDINQIYDNEPTTFGYFCTDKPCGVEPGTWVKIITFMDVFKGIIGLIGYPILIFTCVDVLADKIWSASLIITGIVIASWNILLIIFSKILCNGAQEKNTTKLKIWYVHCLICFIVSLAIFAGGFLMKFNSLEIFKCVNLDDGLIGIIFFYFNFISIFTSALCLHIIQTLITQILRGPVIPWSGYREQKRRRREDANRQFNNDEIL